MNVKKIALYYGGYAVGVYVLQRFVLNQLLPLPLPIVTDPIGTLLGYPTTVKPASGVSTPSTVASTCSTVALLQSQGG